LEVWRESRGEDKVGRERKREEGRRDCYLFLCLDASINNGRRNRYPSLYLVAGWKGEEMIRYFGN
jgi:hypothetical protein